MTGFSKVLFELAKICERMETAFPDFRLVLTEVNGSWKNVVSFNEDQTESASCVEVYESDVELEASEELEKVSQLIVRTLHRGGEGFVTPMGSIQDQFEEPDGWYRLLFFSSEYVDSEDILDLPLKDLRKRELQCNPFLASRLLLMEIAGRNDDGQTIPKIIESIIKQPSWPRFGELDWDDEIPGDASEVELGRGFSDGQLRAVRHAIKGRPKLGMKPIINVLRSCGTGMGTVKLTKILDHIRQHYPEEYTVQPRSRRRRS